MLGPLSAGSNTRLPHSPSFGSLFMDYISPHHHLLNSAFPSSSEEWLLEAIAQWSYLIGLLRAGVEGKAQSP